MDIFRIIPLVISLAAVVISLLAYLRTGRQNLKQAHRTALNLIIDLESTLSILQSNLLTMDLANYRSEVVEVVEAARAQLPKLISSARDNRKIIETLPNSQKIMEFELALQSICTGARDLAEMISHGLERGKIK